MKNKLIIKNTKIKFYHKLLNNEVVYDKKPLKRYKQNITSEHLKDKFKNLDLLKNKINSIKNCELKNSAQQIVFSDGNPDAKIMIIGEGPGANEDKGRQAFCRKGWKTFG